MLIYSDKFSQLFEKWGYMHVELNILKSMLGS